jgi:hypothetical protein
MFAAPFAVTGPFECASTHGTYIKRSYTAAAMAADSQFAFIESNFANRYGPLFGSLYMQRLFDYAYKRAAINTEWNSNARYALAAVAPVIAKAASLASTVGRSATFIYGQTDNRPKGVNQ